MTVMDKVSDLLWLLKINVCEFYLKKLQMILNNKWNLIWITALDLELC